MLSVHPLAIADDETAASLHEGLAALGAQAIVDALARLDALEAQKQDEAGVTYAHKLSKEEARVDWTQDADTVARAIRAYNPAPGAHTLLNGETLKLWMAHALPGDAEPGVVVSASADGVLVGCGQGLVCLTELQAAGGKRLAARDFVAGRTLQDLRLGA